ncbi:MAG TPA: hypothetical protein VI451_19320, partial [Anaerolineales bacterium]|nr:hypothetical protein [Anaerolineales bacterium]
MGSPENDRDTIFFLATTTLCKYVDQASLYKITPYLGSLRPAIGQRIMQEGDSGDSLFIVRHGRLRVVSFDVQGNEIF